MCFRAGVFAFVTLAAIAATPVKIGVPELAYSGLTPVEGNTLVEFFANRLARTPGVQVVTPSSTAALLGYERQRQLLGCDEGSTSCLAELANAMGIDFVVAGSLARLGAGFTVAIKLLEVRSGRAKFSASERLANEDALSAWLAVTAEEWGRALAPHTRSVAPFIIGGIGLAAGVTGGVLLGLSAGVAGELRARPLPPTLGTAQAIESAAARGSLFQSAGFAAAAVGVVGLAVGVIWWLLDGPPPSSAAWSTDTPGLAWSAW